ncbi:MAG: hypothetical protein NXI28_23770 [bacterium]|nr:hypothetical protein [bacterium]
MMKQVADVLGYKRLGSNIKKTLKGHMRAAIRRQIIEADGDEVRALTGSITDYERDELRDVLSSVMRKGTVYDLQEVITAATHYLGFRRVTQSVRKAFKSAITSAIRQDILDYDGQEIWRIA